MQEIAAALTAAQMRPSNGEGRAAHPGNCVASVLGNVAPGFLAAACLCGKRWETTVFHDCAAPSGPPQAPQTELPLRLFAATGGSESELAGAAGHLPPDWLHWAKGCRADRLRFFPEPYRERGVWFTAGEAYREPEWARTLDFTARLLVMAAENWRAAISTSVDERDEVLEQEFAKWLLAPDAQILCEMLGGRLIGEFGLGQSLFYLQREIDEPSRPLYAHGVEPAMAESVRRQVPLSRLTPERPEERLWLLPRPDDTPMVAGENTQSRVHFPYGLVLHTRTGARLVGVLGDRHRRRLSPENEQRLRHWLRHFELALDHQQRIAQLEAFSFTDALTGIYNRRFFKRRLAEELTRARRFGRSLSLVVLDVDNLKEINDTQGHQAGDDVLREVAVLLSATARSIDIACRYGGDEFVIILPDTAQADCFSFTMRLQHSILQHPFRPGRGNAEVRRSVSLGAAVFPQHAGEAERLFWCADVAMLKAKEGGRNRVLIYEPGMDHSSRPSRR